MIDLLGTDMIVVLSAAVLLTSTVIAYWCGKSDNWHKEQQLRDDLAVIKHELATTRRVQHNLNCLIGDMKVELKIIRPDALAYGTCVGLWATDQPDLIKHHAKRERFFRIGYPEHKL